MIVFFFFSSRRRHTRLQGDWSSDVCSSDLDMWIGEHRIFAGVHGDRSQLGERPRPRDVVVVDVRLERVGDQRSEEHTSELQSPCNLVCRLLLEKKKKTRESRPPTMMTTACR